MADQEQGHGNKEEHVSAGEYVKSAVFGGFDGLCTCLIIVIAGVGNASTPTLILAIGVSSMLGDGLGMGAADYLGTKSDDEYMTQEENRERQEIENDFEAEKEEMIHIYTEMGLEKAVSNEIVDILSKNKEGFLKIMMIEELQLLAGGENPFTNSVVTFISFVLFGFTPLIPTLIAHAQGLVHMNNAIIIQTIIISVFFLAVLGLCKSCVGGLPWYLSIPETLLVGALASGAAYGMGKALAG